MGAYILGGELSINLNIKALRQEMTAGRGRTRQSEDVLEWMLEEVQDDRGGITVASNDATRWHVEKYVPPF